MAWLESHQDLRDHPKTARLRRRLGVSLPAAIGHLHLLWWWALTYADDGDLSGYDPDVIADAGGWDADPGLFVRALTTSGFVDDDLRIHDWDDYAGRLIDRRTENARRMREAREQRRTRVNGHSVATSSAAPTSVSGPREPEVLTTSGPCATQVQGLPDPTGPNPTEPERTTTPQPPPHAEGARPPGRRRRGDSSEAETAPLVPPTPEDLALWRRARDDVADGMLPANAERLAALEPLGRGADGGLRLRAPPELGPIGHVVGTVRAALAQAGDPAGGNASIVTEG